MLFLFHINKFNIIIFHLILFTNGATTIYSCICIKILEKCRSFFPFLTFWLRGASKKLSFRLTFLQFQFIRPRRYVIYALAIREFLALRGYRATWLQRHRLYIKSQHFLHFKRCISEIQCRARCDLLRSLVECCCACNGET